MENRIKKTKSNQLNISIVIPTYNRSDLAINLAQQIRQLYTKKYQIIIVDQENHNQPDEKIIKELNIEYFNLPNANTSLAKNKGIETAQGDIVVFFDDDVEITNITLTSHLKAYKDPNVVGVAGRVINDGEVIPSKSQVETGISNYMATKFVYKFWSTKKQIVDFVYGCNMSFRKKILDSVGGFDIEFPKIFEEVDLSMRVKKMGEIIFEPEALVYHHKAKSGGIRKDEEQKANLIYKNYGHFIAKHVPFPFSVITILIRSISALKTNKSAVFSLFSGYKNYFF